MTAIEHGERIMIAADNYARAHAEDQYGQTARFRRDTLKEAIRAATDEYEGAVDLIRELADCPMKGAPAESVDGQAWNDRAWVIERCRTFLGGQ